MQCARDRAENARGAINRDTHSIESPFIARELASTESASTESAHHTWIRMRDACVTPDAEEAQPLSAGGLPRGRRPRHSLFHWNCDGGVDQGWFVTHTSPEGFTNVLSYTKQEKRILCSYPLQRSIKIRFKKYGKKMLQPILSEYQNVCLYSKLKQIFL